MEKTGHLPLVLLVLLAADPAAALPTMIRLGYSDCAACHLSPQGGGLLTPYGKGVDAAQSLRGGEYDGTDARSRRFLFDVRTVTGTALVDSSAESAKIASSTFRVMARSSMQLTHRLRATLTVGLDSPSATRAMRSGRTGDWNQVAIGRALFEFRPRDGLEIAVGRDELPTGLGLPDPQGFMRRQNDPGATAFPTQVKLFWWTPRFQLSPYALAPAPDEDASVGQYGAGVLGGLDVWQHRAVIGASARASRSPTFRRHSGGVFARLGFGRWGVLTEHDLTSRRTDGEVAASQYVAGYTQLFFAVREWLVTSVASDHLVVRGPGVKSVQRLAVGAQLRFSDHITAIFTTRADGAPAKPMSARTYSVQVAVKGGPR